MRESTLAMEAASVYKVTRLRDALEANNLV
jgi:hypothetical protein